MTEGLHPRDPEFDALIRGAGRGARDVAVAAAARALTCNRVSDNPVPEVLALLRGARLDAAARHRDAVVALAEKADHEYLSRVDPESREIGEQPAMLFARARALSALANALLDDPARAAWEAIYEAYAALPDRDGDEFVREMKELLRRRQAPELGAR
jgi:hypothetical protein